MLLLVLKLRRARGVLAAMAVGSKGCGCRICGGASCCCGGGVAAVWLRPGEVLEA